MGDPAGAVRGLDDDVIRAGMVDDSAVAQTPPGAAVLGDGVHGRRRAERELLCGAVGAGVAWLLGVDAVGLGPAAGRGLLQRAVVLAAGVRGGGGLGRLSGPADVWLTVDSDVGQA